MANGGIIGPINDPTRGDFTTTFTASGTYASPGFGPGQADYLVVAGGGAGGGGYGGGCWPIYLEPNSEEGTVDEKTGNYKPSKSKGTKVLLQPGDMLVYRGNELEHWRDELTFDDCAQVFLHYNNTKTEGSKENIYDRRAHLGLPAWFKK